MSFDIMLDKVSDEDEENNEENSEEDSVSSPYQPCSMFKLY